MYHVLIVVCMYLHLECAYWTTCTCILMYVHILWTDTVIPHLMYNVMYMQYSGPHCGAPCTRSCTLLYMLDQHCDATCTCILMYLLTHTLHKMLHNVKLLGRKHFLCGCIAKCESFLHKFGPAVYYH